jgi:hypothetical protein
MPTPDMVCSCKTKLDVFLRVVLSQKGYFNLSFLIALINSIPHKDSVSHKDDENRDIIRGAW